MGKRNKKKKYFIAVDLGGTKLLTALVDSKFRILHSLKIKVELAEGQKNFIRAMIKNIHDVLGEADIPASKVAAIGIGCPGIIDFKKGVVVSSPNIPFLKKFPLAKILKNHFKVPVVLENDVNVGLYGEQQFGSAKGYDDVIGMFLGTGIGGALILNGKPYRGASGGAGEIGHIPVDAMGPLCGCGARGCLEAFAGRLAIASEAAVLALRQNAPKLFDLAESEVGKIKSGVLAKAAKSGDRAIVELFERKAKILGSAMAGLVNVLNPQLFVLGGGLIEAAGNFIVPEATKTMKKMAMPALAAEVEVRSAKLGDFAIVKGAAKMASEAFEKGERKHG